MQIASRRSLFLYLVNRLNFIYAIIRFVIVKSITTALQLKNDSTWDQTLKSIHIKFNIWPNRIIKNYCKHRSTITFTITFIVNGVYTEILPWWKFLCDIFFNLIHMFHVFLRFSHVNSLIVWNLFWLASPGITINQITQIVKRKKTFKRNGWI